MRVQTVIFRFFFSLGENILFTREILYRQMVLHFISSHIFH